MGAWFRCLVIGTYFPIIPLFVRRSLMVREVGSNGREPQNTFFNSKYVSACKVQGKMVQACKERIGVFQVAWVSTFQPSKS